MLVEPMPLRKIAPRMRATVVAVTLLTCLDAHRLPAALPAEVTRLEGPVPGAPTGDGHTGQSLALAPDFDGDGTPDMALASPNVSTLSLIFNLPAQIGSTKIPDDAPQLVLGTETRLTMATADLNTDGLTDLLVGLPDLDGQGAVVCFYGRTVWPTALTLAEADWRIDGPTASELGSALYVAPAADNSARTVFIGAPGDGGGAGRIYLFQPAALSALGGGTTVAAADLADFSIEGDYSGGRLGEHLHPLSDLDGDGLTDTALSAPQAGPGGAVHLLLSQVERDQSTSSSLPTVGSTTGSARAGSSVLALDLDGNGTQELLVGAPGSGDLPGQIFILQADAVLAQSPLVLEASPYALTGTLDDVGLGEVLVSPGDLTGDGLPELLIGIPGAGSGNGQVALVLGSALDALPLELANAPFAWNGQDAEGLGTHVATRLLTPTPSPTGLTWFGAPFALSERTQASVGAIYGLDLQTFLGDADLDGVSLFEGDCDDTNAEKAPGLKERCDGIDNDCDGAVHAQELEDSDLDGAPACTDLTGALKDCNDSDSTTFPGATELCDALDNNCDGQIPTDEQDSDQDGYIPCDGDCLDSDPLTYPNAEERCNGLDDSCSGELSPSEADADQDGVMSCEGDCDDQDATFSPNAPELCDGQDNNCDGTVPEIESDIDQDGYRGCKSDLGDDKPADCDDQDLDIHPGAEELCDGVDNDCSGAPADNESDADQDSVRPCEGDCNDGEASIYPGALELCNALDDDCDAQVPPDEVDADGDNVRVCANDCDDTSNTIYPGAPERCNGLDDDCNGERDVDADQDGVFSCSSETTPADCDDHDNTVYPGAPELCDGKDNPCNGSVDAEELDTDGDKFSPCSGDCNDQSDDVYPNATERCDGLDNNCDDALPSNETDADADNFPLCKGDCDDGDADIHPGAVEICDGLDTNCDTAIPSAETTDADEDGYFPCKSDPSGEDMGDCDDSDATSYPGAPEVKDGADNDCNGIEDDLPCIDQDGDGFPVDICIGSGELDCNDTNSSIYPGASEGLEDPKTDLLIGDGIDNDCDNKVDEGTDRVDDDDDGFSELGGDCDDADDTLHPNALEVQGDGIDNDCNGLVDDDHPREDNDGDGYVNQSADGSTVDCDDTNPDVHPAAVEDSTTDYDDNCDGSLSVDADGDGVDASLDCDDANSSIQPAAAEILDGLDNNCNDQIDEGLSDGPGWSCGALAQSEGVALNCSVAPSPETPSRRPAPLPWLMLGGLLLLLRRRH